jgi:hypothetical protein
MNLTRQSYLNVAAAGLAILLLWSSTTPAWAAASSFSPEVRANDISVENRAANSLELLTNGNSPDAGDIPSETVSRFVSAYLAVVELIESKEASLQRAETETESRQMQEEIQREAMDLIKNHELTLQAYWELLGLANNDPEFRERVLAQVEEARL